MFQRVLLEQWHHYVPYVGFALIGSSFLIILFRAILLKPEEAGRLAALPLRDDQDEAARTANPDIPSHP
jgi:hypothetical protein